MHSITVMILAATCLPASAAGQVPNQDSHFTERATIQHGTNSATVVANSPRPLEQAVKAVGEEYGWTINFEDPPYYSQYDLVDATVPAWRAQHPNEKGVTNFRGGAFQSQYSESPNTASSATEEQNILNKLVSDYNQSGNPGRFSLRSEGKDRFSIIGTIVTDEKGQSKQVPSVLDFQISISPQARDCKATLELILSTLSAQSGIKVFPGLLPLNLLAQCKVIPEGQNVPARTLLQQVLCATNRKLYWELLYDPDGKTYAFSVLPVERAEYDASGNRTTMFVK